MLRLPSLQIEPPELYPRTRDLEWLEIASLHVYFRACRSAGVPYINHWWTEMIHAGQIEFVPACVRQARLQWPKEAS